MQKQVLFYDNAEIVRLTEGRVRQLTQYQAAFSLAPTASCGSNRQRLAKHLLHSSS
jgi:hypothetical protein